MSKSEEKTKQKLKYDEKKTEEKAISEAIKTLLTFRKNTSRKKTALLLSNQWRQIIINHSIAKEWQAEYKDIYALFYDVALKLKSILITKCIKGQLSPRRIYLGQYLCILVSRTKQGYKGQLIEKSRANTPFAGTYDFKELTAPIATETAHDSLYAFEFYEGALVHEFSRITVITDLQENITPVERKFSTSLIIIKNYNGIELSRQVATGEWSNKE